MCLVASDGKYYKADASVSTKRDVKGIAGNTASAAGQRIDIISASQNLVVGAHGGTIGAPYFSSSTAGKLCPLGDLTTNDLATLVAYPVSTSGLEVLIAPALNALGA